MTTEEIRAVLVRRFEARVREIAAAIEHAEKVPESEPVPEIDHAVRGARNARRLIWHFDGAITAAQAQVEREEGDWV